MFSECGLIKTRSFDDLVSELKTKDSTSRRLSDPSIVFGDNNMPLTVSIFQENPSTSSATSNTNNHNNTNINSSNNNNNTTNISNGYTKNAEELIKATVNGNEVVTNGEAKCAVVPIEVNVEINETQNLLDSSNEIISDNEQKPDNRIESENIDEIDGEQPLVGDIDANTDEVDGEKVCKFKNSLKSTSDATL